MHTLLLRQVIGLPRPVTAVSCLYCGFHACPTIPTMR